MQGRPSEIVERLTKALERSTAEVAYLRARLVAQDIEVEDEPPPWAFNLEPAAVALMTILVEAKGRVVSTYALEEMLPKSDHAADRNVKIVDVYVHRIRKALGRDVIENVWGKGYRCSARFLATVAPLSPDH